MIIIIRALALKKGKAKKRGKANKKRPKKGGQCYYPFPHLCFKVAPCSSYRESLELSLSYTSGNFHYRTCLVYSNDGRPQIALGLHEQASWMHTHLVFFLSFHKLIALVHPLHGNPYSSCWHQLMGIFKARWLSSSIWDFLLFCLLHNHHILFHM